MQQKAGEEPGNEASTGAGVEESLHSSLPSAACYSLFVHNESVHVSLPVFQVMSCCMIIIMLSIYYPLQLLQVVLSILLVHRSLAGTYLL